MHVTPIFAKNFTTEINHSMWKIPSEQDLHRHTWLAYPWDRRIWGNDLSAAQGTITNLIRAISSYESVRLLVPAMYEKSLARRFQSSEIEIIPANYNDIWVRDTLPTFAVGSDSSLIAVDWHFNGWGKTPGLPYTQDAKLSRLVAHMAGASVVDADVIAEGGAFAFDGQDTIVATKSVMLHARRNGGRSLYHLQKALLQPCSCASICWLPGDISEAVTRGHADAIIAFANRSTVLFHWIENEQCWERKICEENLTAFKSWMDQHNRKYAIIKLPSLPSPKRQYCTSYVNFAHVNGAIMLPVHGGRFAKLDDRATGIVSEVFGKPVVPVPIGEIAAYGGGIHCATQQEPMINATIRIESEN